MVDGKDWTFARDQEKKKKREMERTHWFQSRHKIKCVPCYLFFYHHVLETATYSVVETQFIT